MQRRPNCCNCSFPAEVGKKKKPTVAMTITDAAIRIVLVPKIGARTRIKTIENVRKNAG